MMLYVRWIDDPALPGPVNMARDEALLLRVGEGLAPPTLRLYGWDPPTISLGYFQRYAEYAALPPPAGGLAIVRRTTGGGAILHDLEVTYSLTMPLDHPWLGCGPGCLYEVAHRAVIAAVEELGAEAALAGVSDDSGPARGPFFCFARRHKYDVVQNGSKLAGSAQRRTRSAVLQHGSIVLGNRFSQQPTAVVAFGFEPAAQRLREAFPRLLAEQTQVAITRGDWSAEELALAETLTPKYAGDEWTRRA